MLSEILLKYRAYKILNFLTLHRGQSFYDKEISENTGVSRGATNQVLNNFLKNNVVEREKKGRMWFYSVNPQPLLKHFRIFENLVELSELVQKLSPFVKRIILFGSTALGEDTAESDIDLFILTDNKEAAMKEIRGFKTAREIKPIVQTPLEFAESREKDSAFYAEVNKGIILLDKDNHEL